MPLSKDRIRFVAVSAAFIVLLAAAAVIIIENPQVLSQVFSTPEKPTLQIISRDYIAGRNESGKDDVNVSFIVTVKNTGTLNESKVLVCSVTFKTDAGVLNYHNNTIVSLTPGETRTYKSIVNLPECAKSVSWTLTTVFE